MNIKYLILFIVIVSGCRNKTKVKTGLEGKTMPNIELLGPDSSTHFNTNGILNGKPTILFAFQTWCPYCRAQIKSIISKVEVLNNFNIYMLCYSSFSEFEKFYELYELNKYPNIKGGVDYKMSFAQYFKSGDVPLMAVYDGRKKLKQVFVGKTPITTIKKVVTE